jgi:PAS domain S-box-containing protein
VRREPTRLAFGARKTPSAGALFPPANAQERFIGAADRSGLPLPHEERSVSAAATIETPVEQLDLGTVMKVSQAVSGEIVLEQLVQTLMVIAVEHAGAARGLLVLLYGEEFRIAAEARTGQNQVEVQLQQAAVTPFDLPDSLLRYVIRTHESVILDDASVQNLFSEDEYLRREYPRSILCVPLVKQARLMGVLYLENNLAPGVFTPNRLAILELLASQAAISLDHARLYADLIQENNERRKAEEALRASEERWSVLAENSSAGIALIAPNGRFIAANLALQEMLGYTESELQGRTVTDISHEEDRASTEARIADVYAGRRRVYRLEKRYLRKNGNVMWADVSSVLVSPCQWKRFCVFLGDYRRHNQAQTGGGEVAGSSNRTGSGQPRNDYGRIGGFDRP